MFMCVHYSHFKTFLVDWFGRHKAPLMEVVPPPTKLDKPFWEKSMWSEGCVRTSLGPTFLQAWHSSAVLCRVQYLNCVSYIPDTNTPLCWKCERWSADPITQSPLIFTQNGANLGQLIHLLLAAFLAIFRLTWWMFSSFLAAKNQ